MDRSYDRHIGRRSYKSGFDKLKEKKEKQLKDDTLLSKTHKMTDYFSSSVVSKEINKNLESNETSDQENLSEVKNKLRESDESNDALDNERNVDNEEKILRTNIIEVQMNDNLQSSEKELSFDISEMQKNSSSQIDHLINVGSSRYQNCSSILIDSKSFVQHDGNNLRKCKSSMFERTVKNGETVKRSWLCFSPITGKLYCFHCKLFSSTHSQFTTDGFCDWKNASNRLYEHEKSLLHLKAVCDFTMRASKLGIVSTQIKKQVEDEKNYWKKILERVIDVILFLAERNLPFRGQNEILGDPSNGNFLGAIELLATRDDFLKAHILKYGSCGKGKVNYLSSTICEELITIINNQLLTAIIENIKSSKYYSISVDSTTDVGHVDQLCLTIRYIENDEPIERFLTFLSNKGHKAQDIFEAITSFLKVHNLDLNDCRGQSYDNASVMSGRFNGLQALFNRENNLALWIPCFAHSLNLVGTAAMSCCREATKFFEFLEKIYVFFTAFTKRYELLCNKLKNNKIHGSVPKRVSTTRWESRAEAVQSLHKGLDVYKEVLEELSTESFEANGLFKFLTKLETVIYIFVWNDILERVNKTSLKLQSYESDLNTSIALLRSLKSFIEFMRNNFESYESLGKEASKNSDYDLMQKRIRKTSIRLNPLDYSQTKETQLVGSEKFRVECYIPIIDQIVVSLTQKITAYEKAEESFGFLRQLKSLSSQDIKTHASKLLILYKDDLEDNLINKLVQFKEFINELGTFENKEEKICVELKMYKLIVENDLKDIFSNIYNLLKIYLVIMTTNCTGERSFSKLKLIKNRLRASMDQDRLNNLSLMSIESDLLRRICYDDVIKEFSEKKSRKVNL